MGIFDRLSTLFRSNLNDLISRAENPEKMLNQLLIDMNEQMIESVSALQNLVLDESKVGGTAAGAASWAAAAGPRPSCADTATTSRRSLPPEPPTWPRPRSSASAASGSRSASGRLSVSRGR